MARVRRFVGTGALLGVLLLVLPAVAHAQTCDTGLDADCDGDLFTIADGDCDDQDPDVHPVAKEVCDDQLDNDCDGLFDEDCDQALRQGGIRGGGGCTGGSSIGGTAAGVVLPLLGLGLVRRREER